MLILNQFILFSDVYLKINVFTYDFFWYKYIVIYGNIIYNIKQKNKFL